MGGRGAEKPHEPSHPGDVQPQTAVSAVSAVAVGVVQAAAMVVCAAYGAENPHGALYCNGCAASLAVAETTRLGEKSDPDAARHR